MVVQQHKLRWHARSICGQDLIKVGSVPPIKHANRQLGTHDTLDRSLFLVQSRRSNRSCSYLHLVLNTNRTFTWVWICFGHLSCPHLLEPRSIRQDRLGLDQAFPEAHLPSGSRSPSSSPGRESQSPRCSRGTPLEGSAFDSPFAI